MAVKIPQQFAKYNPELIETLKEVSGAFVDYFNNIGSMAKLNEACERWRLLVKKINYGEDQGVIISATDFMLMPFVFTGDPVKDLGQYNKANKPN